MLSDAHGGGLGLASDDVFYFGNSVGDCDGDGAVGSSDYGMFVGELGRRGYGQASDFNGDGRVGLSDFVIMRKRFGSAVATPAFPVAASVAAAPAASPSELELEDLALFTEETRPGAIFAADSPVVNLAPVVDLLVESLLTGEYISEPQPTSTATLQRAATGEYDLRSLGDELSDYDLGDDLLVDILSESSLVAR